MVQNRHFIGDVAKEFGISPKTIRWYESQGLIPEAGRTESGYRVYTSGDIERVRFIRKALAFGFGVKEIKDILDLRSMGEAPCELVLSILDAKLGSVCTQIKALRELEKELRELKESWRQKAGGKSQTDAVICTCIESSVDPSRSRRKHGKAPN